MDGSVIRKFLPVAIIAIFSLIVAALPAQAEITELPSFMEKDSPVPDNLPAILERIEAGEDPSEMNLTSPGDYEADLLENIDQSKFLSDSGPNTLRAPESFSLVQAAALQAGPPYTYNWISNLTRPWRYVKLVVTESNSPPWTTVAELEIYDVSRINIAKGKTATASSIYRSGYEASKAVDGNINSWWVTAEGLNNDWLKIDFGEPALFSEIIFISYLGHPQSSVRNFTIQVSNDDVTYKTIANITDNALDTTTHSVPPISGVVGTFNSLVFDALLPVNWTQISWGETLPAGTDITLKVRTSDDGVTWPDWATITSVTNPLGSAVNLQGRYVEYQASLTSTDPSVTPTLGEVSLEYTSNTLMVPAYSPKIQDAINAASPGVTVLVAPGTYTESITMKEGVTVEGAIGPELTTIKGNGSSFLGATYTVMCANDSTIKGFTITGSDRGIWCYYSDSTIVGNHIRGNGRGIWNDYSSPSIINNTVSGNGNGIWNYYSSPTISQNQITGNSWSSWAGGGIINRHSSPLIVNNTIAHQSHAGIDNEGPGSPTITGNEIYRHGFWAFFPGRRGGGPGSWEFVFGYGIHNSGTDSTITNNKIWGNGLYGISSAYSTISNNIIFDNTYSGISTSYNDTIITNNIIANNDGGISTSASISITNNIIANNGQYGISCSNYYGSPTISHNDLWDNNYANDCPPSTNDIYADPLFVDPAAQDFHLQAGSPAIDAGTNDAPGIPEMDFDGNFRIWDGDGDGVATVDMGAFEYVPPSYVTDSDNDGLTDDIDACDNTDNTEIGQIITDPASQWYGCGPSERDLDGDGVNDSFDQCLNTPAGATVDDVGCSDSANQTVSSDGGNVSTDTGSVTMEIPPGAVTTNETITIVQNDSLSSAIQGSIIIAEKTGGGQAASFPEDYGILSPVYTIEPSGLEFQVDVNLTLMFNASLAVDPTLNEVELYEYNGSAWVPLGGIITQDGDMGYILIDLNALNSDFVVLEVYDTDDDGYNSGVDCDDNDPNVHPGATELCDGIDNDCDGAVDNNPIDLDDGNACTTDSCVSGQVVNAPVPIDDSVACTVDSCDVSTGEITHLPADSICDNGMFCDGSEICDATLDCQAGTPVECSANNLSGIAMCLYDPDSNPLTWDFFAGFTSVCNEELDACTTGTVDLIHTCSIDMCGAECESDADCADTECDALDGCYDGTYREYSDVPNSCTDACVSTTNECSAYIDVVTDADADGYDTECDDDCNDNDASVNPGTFEIPGNSVDENCDTAVLCDSSSEWKNHGAYVSCVTKESKKLLEQGHITEKEKGAIVSEAAKSDVGKKNKK